MGRLRQISLTFGSLRVTMSPIASNKYTSQQLQKKMNRRQYASKHYDTYTSPIFKRKKPVKQRKDHKKFKAQRARKKTLKQMAFDYTDFIHQNQTENRRRIQIAPTIQYSDALNIDIAAVSEQYYSPENDDTNYHIQSASSAIRTEDIRSVLFEAEYFYTVAASHGYGHSMLEYQRRQRRLKAQLQDNADSCAQVRAKIDPKYKRYTWYRVYEKNQLQGLQQKRAELVQRSKALARDLHNFESKGFAYANTTIRVRGHSSHLRVSPRTDIRRVTKDPMRMANAAWNAYQKDLDIRSLVTMTHANTRARSSVGAPLELSNLLVATIPELWAMHAIIFQFMGYDRLFKETFSLEMSLVKEKRQATRPNHGITFYETRHYSYEKRTRQYFPKKRAVATR